MDSWVLRSIGWEREAGWVDQVVVIPGCETPGVSGMEVHFSHICRTFWASFATVLGGVGSFGGWWILGHSYTTCLAVFSPIPHFLQMESTAHYFVHPVLVLRVEGHLSDSGRYQVDTVNVWLFGVGISIDYFFVTLELVACG